MRLKTQVVKAFERDAPGLSQAKIKLYSTARSAILNMWRVRNRQQQAAGDGPIFDSIKELRAIEFSDGRNYDEIVEAYEEMGIFAFANTLERKVHLWFTPSITRLRLIAVLAHELGHIADEFPRDKKWLGGGRYGRSEWRADTYGEAAVIATIWAEKLLASPTR